MFSIHLVVFLSSIYSRRFSAGHLEFLVLPISTFSPLLVCSYSLRTYSIKSSFLCIHITCSIQIHYWPWIMKAIEFIQDICLFCVDWNWEVWLIPISVCRQEWWTVIDNNDSTKYKKRLLHRKHTYVVILCTTLIVCK